jgi:hypothetical protein
LKFADGSIAELAAQHKVSKVLLAAREYPSPNADPVERGSAPVLCAMAAMIGGVNPSFSLGVDHSGRFQMCPSHQEPRRILR